LETVLCISIRNPYYEVNVFGLKRLNKALHSALKFQVADQKIC